jgi:hypothetical protein
MKLNPALVERTLSQIFGEVIPDDHPVVQELKRMFGDHTFFLDNNGLSIVERMEEKSQTGKVVNLANWDEADPPHLVCHMPEPTDLVIEFETLH